MMLSLVAVSSGVYAQGQDRDSLVTLVSAKSAQLIEKDGVNYRKVIGPARFLHNDTYLLCDTALWNVGTNIIDAVGHVQIIQDQTRLRSETLQYVADDDLAKFRGNLVELEDKDHNMLRTRYLDYNTKDSVAIFQNGASMKDKDGQIIESQYGSYDSKAHLFVFNDRVNMFSDSIFVKTSRLEYRSDLNTASFGFGTDMWESDNMLSANDGWYDRSRELFFFRRNVHIMTRDQEAWSDTLFYYRTVNDVDMRGKVELMDTTRNVFALAGRFEYSDSLSRVKMTRRPAVMSVSEEKERRDTVYLGADTLLYRTLRRCDVDSLWVVDAQKRLKDLEGDPVMEYRKKAAEAARKAAEEAAKDDPDRPPDIARAGGSRKGAAAQETVGKDGDGPGKGRTAGRDNRPGPASGDTVVPPGDASRMPGDTLLPPDTLRTPSDTLTMATPTDSVAVEAPKDTTKIGFIWAVNHVKLYREDMQMSCDSLTYTDLDSLVRLYRDPLVFNEGNRQYAADSIFVVIRNRAAERANLMSNAFVTTQEDSLLNAYDQIRGTEMVAYFDSTRTLTRFDALGGASALFFLQENDALATVNKVEAKMLYALFKEGNLDKIYYFEEPKNDAYPVVQLPKEERQLKGFRWDPDRRPRGRADITPLVPRPSERTSYLARPHAEFKETDIYFPGYIGGIYKEIACRDSMAVLRSREKAARAVAADSLAAGADMLSAGIDSPAVPSDTLGGGLPTGSDSLSVADSLSKAGTDDNLSVTSQPDDSLASTTVSALSGKERRALEKQRKEEEKARLKAERQAAREAKWAEEDRIYEEKQAAKARKKLEKERARKLKALRKIEKKAQKERLLLEKYLARERRKAARRQQ